MIGSSVPEINGSEVTMENEVFYEEVLKEAITRYVF
jgi:hypothetical protein